MDSVARPRLIVFELRLLGDAVMSLPFVRDAATSHEVHVCCTPGTAAVFHMVLPPERIHAWRPPWLEGAPKNLRALRESRAVLQRLRALRATTAVCAWCDPRVAGVMAWLDIPRRVGFPCIPDNLYGYHLPWRARQLRRGQVMEWLAHRFLGRPPLTRALHRRPDQHHVEDWLQVAEAIGVACDPTVPALGAADAPRRERPRIAIHPGASTAEKCWPLPRFVALATALSARGDVSFVQPPELPLDDTVRARFPVIEAAGVTELAERLRAFDLLIANDSGVGHLAAALGITVIAVFIASEPRHFAPFASRDLAISFDDSCDMRPCFGHCLKPARLCHAPVTYEAVAARVHAAMDRLCLPATGDG